MSAKILTAYPRLIRLVGFFLALGFAGVTLWNTYKLIQRIEQDEKQQMELWGLAQQKLASNKDLNDPIDPLTFQILTSDNSIPMIVVDSQNRLLFSTISTNENSPKTHWAMYKNLKKNLAQYIRLLKSHTKTACIKECITGVPTSSTS